MTQGARSPGNAAEEAPTDTAERLRKKATAAANPTLASTSTGDNDVPMPDDAEEKAPGASPKAPVWYEELEFGMKNEG